MRNFTEEQEKKLFGYYESGKTDYDVAQLMRIGRDRLRKWRKLNGILSKSRSKGLNAKNLTEMLKRRENGETYANIALSYGVSHTSILRFLKKKENIDIFSMTSKQFKNMSGEKQNLYIEKAFLYYRKYGFPFMAYDFARMIRIIKSVMNYKQNLSEEIKHCTIGVNFCEHFFPHIYEASRYDKLSPMDIWKDDQKLKNFLKNRFKYSDKFNDAAVRRGLKLLAGVGNFKPMVAKYVYQKYLPKEGVTYDFSAGYGGRLLGFLASGMGGKYIATDPFGRTCEGLNKLCAYWQKWVDAKIKVEIICQCAEEFENISDSVDLVFSCPPYYGLEKYSNEITQSYLKFTTYEQWLEGFWIAVVRNCYKMLKKTGFLIYVVGNYQNYNIIEDFSRICNQEGFEEIRQLKIPLSNMFLKKKKGIIFKFETMFIYKKKD